MNTHPHSILYLNKAKVLSLEKPKKDFPLQKVEIDNYGTFYIFKGTNFSQEEPSEEWIKGGKEISAGICSFRFPLYRFINGDENLIRERVLFKVPEKLISKVNKLLKMQYVDLKIPNKSGRSEGIRACIPIPLRDKGGNLISHVAATKEVIVPFVLFPDAYHPLAETHGGFVKTNSKQFLELNKSEIIHHDGFHLDNNHYIEIPENTIYPFATSTNS